VLGISNEKIEKIYYDFIENNNMEVKSLYLFSRPCEKPTLFFE